MDTSYSGYIEIEDEDYSFFLNGSQLALVPLNFKDFRCKLPYDVSDYDCLYGFLSDRRLICLLGVKIVVTCFGTIKGSVAAIIEGTRNMGDDISIEPINSIRFMGETINRFYSHLRRIDSQKTCFNENGGATLSIKSIQEVSENHNLETESNAGAMQLLLSVIYFRQFSVKDEVIAEIKSIFDLTFEKPLSCCEIREVFIQVQNFFRFLCFRNNIEFDSISLMKNNEKVAELVLLTDNSNANVNVYNTIVYEDIKNNITELFRVVNDSDRSTLFLPKDDKDATHVDYLSYFNTCACFEYFYSRYICKEKKSLENKFRKVLILKKEIINEVYPNLVLNPEGIDIISCELRDQRNKIAHGDTDNLVGLKVNPYVIALCLLYTLILEESGSTKDSIVKILKKLFGHYYINK